MFVNVYYHFRMRQIENRNIRWSITITIYILMKRVSADFYLKLQFQRNMAKMLVSKTFVIKLN